MKKLIVSVICICVSIFSWAQPVIEYGSDFEFKSADENSPKLVLMDNYNTYLFSYINIDGILSSHQVIIRKFDQKNQLLETYKKDFSKIDASTLYNYVGMIELPGSNKLVVFTESYSGKSDIQELHKIVFDKTTGAFTSSLIKSFPMESVNKKGVFTFSASDNNRYVGFLNAKNASKKDAVQNTVLVLDAATQSVSWTKDVTLEAKNYERSFAVTNGGKAVLLRASTGFSLFNFLTVVSADKAEDKQLGEEVQLQKLRSVSIGTQDYIIAFDHDAKGLRKGDYEKFMLYDIDAGKIIFNNKIAAYNNTINLSEVNIRDVFIQNNEFHIFAEGKVKAGTRPVKVNAFSTMTFDEPYYKYGPSFLVIMDFEGKIKGTPQLKADLDALAELYQSFGLVNVRGVYYILGGGNAINKLSAEDNFQLSAIKDAVYINPNDMSLSYTERGSWKLVPQLFWYNSDSKKYLAGRFYNNKLSFVSLSK